MRFIQVLKDRKLANSVKSTIQDMRIESKIKAETLRQLSAILEENDKVMIELNDNAVPYFLNLLDNPAFGRYIAKQVDEYHYEFSNRDLLI